jgi:CRISPR system Cascade subunit CasA
MNLVDDPWIPVVMMDGSAARVSLSEVFADGEQIRDISVYPYERVSLMRLFICVAHASIDGPSTRKDWSECRARLSVDALMYLSKWKSSFELFGEHRFLQVKMHTDGSSGTSASKLSLVLTSGHNSIIFDNEGGSNRKFGDADLALMLLSYQMFSPCGTVTQGKWGGVPTSKGSSKCAPCSQACAIHTYIRCSCLLDTIHANMIDREIANSHGLSWGLPIWERFPESPKDNESTMTYLGSMVPLSRCVWIGEDRATAMVGQALAYETDVREPAKTLVSTDEEGQHYLRAIPGKDIWRELYSILCMGKGVGGPLTLVNHDVDTVVNLWSGTFMVEKAKIIGNIESSVSIPAGMRRDQDIRIYEAGVRYAEEWEKQIVDAVRVYISVVRPSGKLSYKELHKWCARATTNYWYSVGRSVDLLIRSVQDGKLTKNNKVIEDSEWAMTCAAAARKSYDIVCAKSTPNQVSGYAKGYELLWNLTSKASSGAKKVGKTKSKIKIGKESVK